MDRRAPLSHLAPSTVAEKAKASNERAQGRAGNGIHLCNTKKRGEPQRLRPKEKIPNCTEVGITPFPQPCQAATKTQRLAPPKASLGVRCQEPIPRGDIQEAWLTLKEEQTFKFQQLSRDLNHSTAISKNMICCPTTTMDGTPLFQLPSSWCFGAWLGGAFEG